MSIITGVEDTDGGLLRLEYDKWEKVPAGDVVWKWPDFTPFEMRCRRSGSLVIVPEFMDRLQFMRTGLGFPLRVTSGYRSPEYDASIGGAGVHPTGRAVDIAIHGVNATKLDRAAFSVGFTGKGIKQSGGWGERFIHLDDLPVGEDSDHPRPRLWSYSA